MDELVKRALAKWPNVPAVYGWLSLDRRGRWLLRGEHIDNAAITAFIARNYEQDPAGRWYFQNGPQQVFVDLDYTPIILRLGDASRFVTHTGLEVGSIDGGWIDEYGRMVVACEHGPALVDDRDMESVGFWICAANPDLRDEDQLILAIEALEHGEDLNLRFRYADKEVSLQPIRAAEVPGRFGFVPHPRSTAEEIACK